MKWPETLSGLVKVVSYAAGLLLLWQIVIWIVHPAHWLFPSPQAVFDRMMRLADSGQLWRHVGVTLAEVFSGFFGGSLLGFVLGYSLSRFPRFEKLVSPLLVASNSVPVVAFAPLLLLWFGSGFKTKSIVAAVMVFLPVALNTLQGFRSVRDVHRRLMFSLHANRRQVFILLDLPSAMPAILTGLKIAAPLAVVGAVVGEFLGTWEGLGFLILDANARLDTPQLFVALFCLSWVGMGLYFAIQFLEIRLLGPQIRTKLPGNPVQL